MQLLLVVPGLCALPDAALAACPPLGSLAAHANVTADADGLEAAMLRTLHVDVAVAPLAALGSGLRIGDDYLLRADPVSLVAGHDDVRLIGRIDDLRRDEADALRGTLNAHFASDGLVFEAPRPDTWFARLRNAPDVVTAALARAVDRPLASLLPRGGAGRTWRRWQNEIQMLLHGHPVNAAREARGDASVAGLWFWGGGVVPAALTVAGLAVFTGEGRDGDLLRGLARAGNGREFPLPSSLATLKFADKPGKRIGVMLPSPRDADALDQIARNWIAPAVAHLNRGRLRTVHLVSESAAHGALTWTANRPSLLERVRARLAPRPFVVPRKSRPA